jgi:hypothetical protein
VLGGWLPVLAWLSVIGRRLRAPLILATFGALSILVLIVGDNHQVRLSAPDAGANNLECPFLGLRGNDKLWLPLLILNGTSVSNGQRILTTSLAPTYRVPDV